MLSVPRGGEEEKKQKNGKKYEEEISTYPTAAKPLLLEVAFMQNILFHCVK